MGAALPPGRAADIPGPARGSDVICRSDAAIVASRGGPGPGLQAAVSGVATRGRLSVLLVRVSFQDQNGTEPATEAEARALAELVEEFFDRASHGELALEMHLSPLAVVGRQSEYQANDAGRWKLRTGAFAALAVQGIAEAGYDLDVIYSRSTLGHVARVNGRGAWVSDSGNGPLTGARLMNMFGTVCHELGHNLGLGHAKAWIAADGSILGDGVAEEYGNPFDTMGQHRESPSSSSLGRFKPFNAFTQQRLGWLPAAGVAAVTQPGTRRLLPLDVRELTPGAEHALRLRLDGAREYWVEGRTNWPDALLVQAVFPGHGGGEPLLLDTRPEGEGGRFDALLPVGRSLLDPQHGIRITPRRPIGDAPAGALDVEVRRVHHGFHEADAGAPPEDASVMAEDDATEGRAVHLAGPGQTWSVPVSVPAAGRYLVWLRVRSAADGLPLRVASAAGPTFGAFVPASRDWRWLWLQQASAGDPAAPMPAWLTLPAGDSELVLEAAAEAWLDLVLLTDDDSPNLPPYLAPPPPVRLAAGTAAAVVHLSVADIAPARTDRPAGADRGEDTSANLPVVMVRSLNTNLVHFWKQKVTTNTVPEWEPTDRTNLLSAGVRPQVWLSVVPGAMGSTTLRISVVDGDGNGVSRNLPVAVLGPVQGLVEAAGPGGTVRLPPGAFRERLVLSHDVTIEGGVAGTMVEAAGAGPVVQVEAGVRAVLRDLTLRSGTRGIINHGELNLERVMVTGNSAGGIDNRGTLEVRDSSVSGNSAGGRGAGLYNRGSGTAWIENSTFSDNHSLADGGAIANEGRLELVQCTLSGNSAAAGDVEKDREAYPVRGGGLYNSGAATLVACTIVRNVAGRDGGGLYNSENSGVLLVMQNSILDGNWIRGGDGPDGWGEIQSAGFNLVGNPADLDLVGDLLGNLLGQPARLGPLSDHGGPTRTHLPLSGSPVIDAGLGGDATYDQRGVFRRVDMNGRPDAADGADIGAAEYTPVLPARVTASAALDAASQVAVLSITLGAEEAVSGVAFTVQYPPALLRPLRVLPGPDAAGAVIEADAGVSLPGRLGARARFSAGWPAARDGRRVLHAVFEVIRELHDPAQLRFEFTDDVVPRAAAGAGGEAVPVLFPPYVEAAAAPPPRLTVQPQAGGRVAVTLTALPGTSVELEATADFEHWEPLGTLTVTDGPAVLHDAARQPHRFYRWRR
ncbi:MAG: choice-of-anchor Q domain-containing protein [Limisphaerales bacterium]